MSGRRNTKKPFTNLDKQSFYLVGNDFFVGLIFSEKESSFYKIERDILTIPSFTFYNQQQKVIIDYSNSKNEDDLSYIKSFFKSMSGGSTFSISNAKFSQGDQNIVADISGIYEFSSFEQDKIVKAHSISTVNINTKKDFYNAKFFTKIPKLFKNEPLIDTQQRKNIIKNTIPSGLFSFKKLGINVGDYVEFSGNLLNSNKKFKVLEVFLDNDGFENIRVDQPIVNENLIGESVLINLYFIGEPITTISEDNSNEKTYGVCNYTTNDVNVCISAQSQYQCTERTRKNNIQGTYTANADCSEFVVLNNQQPTSTQTSTEFDPFGVRIRDLNTNLRLTTELQTELQNYGFVSGVTTPSMLFSFTALRPKTKSKVIKIKLREGKLVDSEKFENEITVPKNTYLKLNLDDSSLVNLNFGLYENNNSGRKINNIVKYGTPGNVGSFITFNTTEINYSTVYFTAEIGRNMNFKINIV